jgi:beta-mannanase
LIGQNWEAEYNSYTKVFRPPAGVSLYTAQLIEGQGLQWMGDGQTFLKNLNHAYNGYRGLVELTLAWKYATTCNDIKGISVGIANGRFDAQLDEMVDVFKSMPAATFLLRVEYEVSYSLFTCEQPTQNCRDQTYQNAFRYVVSHIRTKKQVANVKFVFHVMYGAEDARCLYPDGEQDEFVDVIGVSFFEGQYDACYKKQDCINPHVNETLSWAVANHPKKQIMFPESTPQDMNGDVAWIVQFLKHVEKMVVMYNVAYWTYINMDWNAHGWAAPGWADSRLQNRLVTRNHWKQNVLGNSRYLCLENRLCSAGDALLI